MRIFFAIFFIKMFCFHPSSGILIFKKETTFLYEVGREY